MQRISLVTEAYVAAMIGNFKEWVPAGAWKGLLALALVGGGMVYWGRTASEGTNGANPSGDRPPKTALRATALRAKVLENLNRDRQNQGLSPLTPDPRLDREAQTYAEAIAQGIHDRGDRENSPNLNDTHFGFGLATNPKTGDFYVVQLLSGPAVDRLLPVELPARPPARLPAGRPGADPFRDAVNTAMAAAKLTQTAKTQAEWATVVEHWTVAIAQMQAVPTQHPRYGVAQHKAKEYTNNLNYAEKNAEKNADAQNKTGTALGLPATSVSPASGSGHGFPDASQSSSQSPGLAIAQAGGDVDASFLPGSTNPSSWLISLVGGGFLVLVMTAGPLGLFERRGKGDLDGQTSFSPSRNSRDSASSAKLSWKPTFSNPIQDWLESQSFFPFSRHHNGSSTASAHQLQRKLYRRLLTLTKDQAIAMHLIKENLRRHPKKSVNWCCEQAIRDLEKQRQREEQLKLPPRPPLAEEPPETSGWG